MHVLELRIAVGGQLKQSDANNPLQVKHDGWHSKDFIFLDIEKLFLYESCIALYLGLHTALLGHKKADILSLSRN